jgi:predicted molibdopterin-dependent oxidoreductase YjgC
MARAGDELKKFANGQIALIGSARMTNEELWLTKKLIESLGIADHDVEPSWLCVKISPKSA